MFLFSQIEPTQELQFIFYLIPVCLGTQLAFYFYYQFYKIQDVHLKLNRILLSFGTFTLLIVFGALFLNITRNFVVSPLLTSIFTKMGWSSALLSPIGFLSFIIIKEFSPVMNLKLVKILMGLSIIPVIIVIILPSPRSPFFFGSLVFTFLSAYYLLGFQVKLIKRSVGTIKTKFKQFFLGELISLAAIGFAIAVGLGLPPGVNEIIYYMGVTVLATGFLILFLCAYEFPAFYEFEWKDNLLKLFIIDQKDNSFLYHCNLTELLKQKDVKPDSPPSQSDGDKILSGGLAGIETIISAITNTAKDKIDTIEQENSFILLEYGTAPTEVTYALLVKKDLRSLHHLLKTIKNQFELLFKEVLLNLDQVKTSKQELFGSFDTIINIITEQ